jgi:serine/threonine protein phosphatase 1
VPLQGEFDMAAGSITYAIGDVHGRADLLEILQAAISADARRHGCDDPAVVYLGDYVDRGPESYRVLDLLGAGLPGFRRTFLKGNHEDLFDSVLGKVISDESSATTWLQNGGMQTLESYGVSLEDMRDPTRDLPAAMDAAMPASHRKLLASLVLSHEDEHGIYVHAGLNPSLERDAQRPEDLLWIREKFLRSGRNWGKPVVHGHTPRWTGPEVRDVRLNLDTGAFHSGFLTCAALSAEGPRFLVGARPGACHLLVDRDGKSDPHWIAWSTAAIVTSGAHEAVLCSPEPEAARRALEDIGVRVSVLAEGYLVAALADPENRLGALQRRRGIAIHYAEDADQDWLSNEVRMAVRRAEAVSAFK